MKPPRETALELLLRIERGGAFADRVLASPRLDGYPPRDRAFVRELVNGVIRWKLRLDAVIDRFHAKPAGTMSPPIRMILRLGLYQLMFLSIPAHAAVDEAVKAARSEQGTGAGGLVNAILRRFLREGEPRGEYDDEAGRLAVEHSHPIWLARRWVERFGPDEAGRIMSAGNGRHPVFIRANPLRTTVIELARGLGALGFQPEPAGGAPDYLAVREPEGLFESEAFIGGLFIVQDPSSGIAAALLDPRPGETVLDLCSAPGGKAAVMAWMTADRGRIVALDIDPGRARLIQENVERLGLVSVAAAVDDALTYESTDGKGFDRVLLDAPCSGTAVFSKRPDMKWRRTEADIARLASLQAEMLRRASGFVKPGGTLVYSTCTLEPEENEAVILSFLAESKDFAVVRDNRFEEFSAGPGYLVPPHRMHGTGAFAAGIRRMHDEP